MEKNIKDFIHFYLGCECVHAFVPEDHPQYDNGWKLVSIQSQSEKPYELDNDTDYTWTDSVKPKLRKLESINREESEMMERFRSELKRNDLTASFRLTHYLLSKGFDLFGLIESRLAIEKQPTLNQGV